jgi:hypothetical protein
MNAVVELDASIVSRVPADEYHAMPGISISTPEAAGDARRCITSWERTHPRKSSSAMTLGDRRSLRRARAAPVRRALCSVVRVISESGNACPRQAASSGRRSSMRTAARRS